MGSFMASGATATLNAAGALGSSKEQGAAGGVHGVGGHWGHQGAMGRDSEEQGVIGSGSSRRMAAMVGTLWGASRS